MCGDTPLIVSAFSWPDAHLLCDPINRNKRISNPVAFLTFYCTTSLQHNYCSHSHVTLQVTLTQITEQKSTVQSTFSPSHDFPYSGLAQVQNTLILHRNVAAIFPSCYCLYIRCYTHRVYLSYTQMGAFDLGPRFHSSPRHRAY